jgi:IS30 family transposase
MNGLLRQHFPKGTDLHNVSLEQVRFVAAEMNGRPPQVLAWRTPAEVHADVIATAA